MGTTEAKRVVIQVAHVRMGDLRVDDVVNGKPAAEQGWFRIQMICQLPSGDLVATGETTAYSLKGSPWDLVGIQVAKRVDLPVEPLTSDVLNQVQPTRPADPDPIAPDATAVVTAGFAHG